MTTLNTISANEIVTALKSQLANIHCQIVDSMYDGSVITKPAIDFEYDDTGFYVEFDIDESTDVRLEFYADISTKDIYKGVIVEFANIGIDGIEINTTEGTYHLDSSNDWEFLEVGREIALNATFYRLVDKNTVTTDDLDVTYSEMSEQYEKYGY